MRTNFLKKYVGDKAFYKMLLALIIPMVVQQGITNFVSLLDNLMVGSLGTEQMSGVAIVNQLFFVYNLAVFGAISGVSIFGAQFFGMGDNNGMRHSLRLKLYFGVFLTALFSGILLLRGEPLICLFLNKDVNDPAALAATLGYAQDYLKVILWGFFPFMMVQVYAGTLRETGETIVPMVASIVAIVVNLTGNYLLIFGNLGFPRLEACGAAIATVASRWVEMAIVLGYAHRNTHKYPFLKGLYASPRVPGVLVRKVLVTGSPLMANELLWALGTTFINQNYSTRGLAVVAANNITSTVWELFSVIMFSMGNAVAILVGQALGAGKIEEARDTDRKLLAFNLVLHLCIGLLMIAAAPLIPMLYNTEPAVRELACEMLMVAGASLPIHAFIHAAYFTIRSGGKTIITFFFDSFYTWVVPVPLSFFLCRHTGLPIVGVYAVIQFIDAVKLFIAVPMLKSGFWANNVVHNTETDLPE
jgi:putative MATE family efflux protein